MGLGECFECRFRPEPATFLLIGHKTVLGQDARAEGVTQEVEAFLISNRFFSRVLPEIRSVCHACGVPQSLPLGKLWLTKEHTGLRPFCPFAMKTRSSKLGESSLLMARRYARIFLMNKRFLSLTRLFPDAELPEYVSEDFVGGDFADDGADIV